MTFNGSTWERQRSLSSLTTNVDTSSARTASGNGTALINYSAPTCRCGSTSPTACRARPVLHVPSAWSPDNGTTWIDWDTTNLQSTAVTGVATVLLKVGQAQANAANARRRTDPAPGPSRLDDQRHPGRSRSRSGSHHRLRGAGVTLLLLQRARTPGGSGAGQGRGRYGRSWVAPTCRSPPRGAPAPVLTGEPGAAVVLGVAGAADAVLVDSGPAGGSGPSQGRGRYGRSWVRTYVPARQASGVGYLVGTRFPRSSSSSPRPRRPRRLSVRAGPVPLAGDADGTGGPGSAHVRAAAAARRVSTTLVGTPEPAVVLGLGASFSVDAYLTFDLEPFLILGSGSPIAAGGPLIGTPEPALVLGGRGARGGVAGLTGTPKVAELLAVTGAPRPRRSADGYAAARGRPRAAGAVQGAVTLTGNPSGGSSGAQRARDGHVRPRRCSGACDPPRRSWARHGHPDHGWDAHRGARPALILGGGADASGGVAITGTPTPWSSSAVPRPSPRVWRSRGAVPALVLVDTTGPTGVLGLTAPPRRRSSSRWRAASPDPTAHGTRATPAPVHVHGPHRNGRCAAH